jgi:ribosome modulation factor
MSATDTAFDEGTDAYCAGKTRSACPYPLDTAEHLEWTRGWNDAAIIDRAENGGRVIRLAARR